jgi:hypothetical protein
MTKTTTKASKASKKTSTSNAGRKTGKSKILPTQVKNVAKVLADLEKSQPNNASSDNFLKDEVFQKVVASVPSDVKVEAVEQAKVPPLPIVKVEAVEQAKVPPLPIVKKSSAESPSKLVWEIADTMTADDPKVRRCDVIRACVEKHGIATHTARTQYQRWFEAKKESAQH